MAVQVMVAVTIAILVNALTAEANGGDGGDANGGDAQIATAIQGRNSSKIKQTRLNQND